MQPENVKEFDDDSDDDFTSGNSYSYGYGSRVENNLDEDQPIKEQLQKIMKMMLYKMHSSAAQFYNNNYDDADNDAFTERIKTNRFGE